MYQRRTIFPSPGCQPRTSGGLTRTATHDSFTGLSPSTDYTISVIATRGGLSSVATTVPFNSGQPALPSPIIDPSRDIIPTGTGVTVHWTSGGTGTGGMATGYTVTLTPTNGGPSITHTLDATATSDSFTGLTTYTDYIISVAAIGGSGGGGSSGGGGGGSGGGSGGSSGGSSAPTFVPFNSGGLDQTNTWVTEYFLGAPVGEGPSNIPGLTVDHSVAGDPGYADTANRTETFTLDNLPRHTYSQVTVHLHPTDEYFGPSNGMIKLKINGEAVHSWSEYDPPEADHGGVYWVWGGDQVYGSPNDSGVQAHTGKGLTIALSAAGFANGYNYTGWQIDYVKVSTYFPVVGLSGQGVSLEGVDYGGDSSNSAPTTSGGYFTVSRSGTPATWGQPLSVTMKPETGSREDGIAIPGQDFQGIDSVTIPAGQQSVDAPVQVLHDDEYGSLQAFESIKNSGKYLLAGPNTVPTGKSTTTQSVELSSANLDNITVISGASTRKVTVADTYAAVKKDGDVVKIKATLRDNFPSERITPALIHWEGATPDPANPLIATVSKSAAAKTTVKCTIGKTSKSLDIYIIWMTPHGRKSGQKTVNDAHFDGAGYGGDLLGELDNDTTNNLIDAEAVGKVEIKFTIDPPSAQTIFLRGAFNIFQTKRQKVVDNNNLITDIQPQDDHANNDDSAETDEDHNVAADGSIYEVDGPTCGDIKNGGGISPGHRRTVDDSFVTWAVFIGDIVSDDYKWEYHAIVDKALNPDTIKNDLKVP